MYARNPTYCAIFELIADRFDADVANQIPGGVSKFRNEFVERKKWQEIVLTPDV